MSIHKFTATKVASIVRAGQPSLWCDGANLYLQIPRNTKRAYWLFIWTRYSRRQAVSLGPVHLVPLAKARQAAQMCKEMVHEGRDPKAELGKSRKRATRFHLVCDEYFALQKEARRIEWVPSIRKHCATIANMPVGTITREDIANVLRPIWLTTHSTATRVQLRLENIFEWAVRQKYCAENPALWKDYLEHDLPRIEHVPEQMKSIDYRAFPAFIAKLRARELDTAAEALLFIALTAVRMGSVTGKYPPKWGDIDFDARIWNVPKIKTRKEGERPFQIPLSSQAIDLLMDIKRRKPGSEYVFESDYCEGNATTERSVRKVQKMLAPDYDVHGHRATFRTYAGEKLKFEDIVIETCLSHEVPGTKSKKAYIREEYLEKRRPLMQAWADYCYDISNVVDLGARMAA
jgi:integrase